MVSARMTYFDGIIARAIKDVDQFVLLGADDTALLRRTRKQRRYIFEVDQAAVQDHKRLMIDVAGIRCEQVNFVPIDFNKDNLFSQLAEAGFDASRKTLFLWEGVSLYLSAEQVSSTLEIVKQQAAASSVIVADLYAERLIKTLAKGSASQKILEMTEETLEFGLPFASDWRAVLSEFIEAKSLKQGETHFLGESNKAGPYAAVVEMIC